MVRVTSTEFAKNFGRYREAAQREPVAITSHGSNIGTAGFVAPGTLVLAMVFLVSFVLYYFVNWKYLSTVWPLS